MSVFRSSLGSLAPMLREPDPNNGREAGKRLWREMGLLVANPAHFGWANEARIKQLAEELYGERKDDNRG